MVLVAPKVSLWENVTEKLCVPISLRTACQMWSSGCWEERSEWLLLESQQTRSCTPTSANRHVANTADGPRPSSCRCKTSQHTITHSSIFHCILHCYISGSVLTVVIFVCQYPMDKNNGVKIPAQLQVNMWLGLSAHEKKFNSFSEGNFSVYAEMVQ